MESNQNRKYDRFSVIYEFNKSSTIFVRVADNELQEGNVQRSIEILEKGLELFPDYSTAYFIYGMALAETDRIEEAKRAIIKGGEILDSKETTDYYLKLIDVYDEEIDVTEKDELEELEELAEQLSNAKIKFSDSADTPADNVEINKEDENLFPAKDLVSETLAGIYYNQENYEEAKSIYKTLIEIQPERADYYNKKISDINEKIEKDNS